MDRFTRFRTLLLREWMQHRTGWLVLAALPTLLAMGLSLLDGKGLEVNTVDMGSLSQLPLVLQTLGWSVATTGLALVLVSLTVLFQLSGLARRDQQDRSIEFWRSLPTSHTQSVGATVLMHLLLLPALALTAALLGAQLVALLSIVLHHGPAAWLQQPWSVLLPSLLLALARLWLGLLLAVLWLSPLLLVTMAASAWIKRWAQPALAAVSLLGVYWLDARLPQPMVGPAFRRMGTEALYALVAPDLFDGPQQLAQGNMAAAVGDLPTALWHDTLRVLDSAASPAFLAALAGGALCFALLVLRRQRAD
jgi:ABC-2 type transport system permease protein